MNRVVGRSVSIVILALLFSSMNLAFLGGAASAAVPTVSFVDYAQCSNDAPPSTSTACPGSWINGILNSNNSHYAEDQVTPQRAEVSYPAGDAFAGATMTFRYQTKKGGINAYELFEQAMEWFEKAEAIRPAGNDDAILRWNGCARIIKRNNLEPREVSANDFIE